MSRFLAVLISLFGGINAQADNGIGWFVGVSTAYGRRGRLNVDVPFGAEPGDTLIVLLSRSDGPLPLNLDGFKTSSASCLKSDNDQRSCFRLFDDCVQVSSNGAYCASFGNSRRGWDLATTVYSRVLTSVDLPKSPLLTIDMKKIRRTNSKPVWSVAVVVRGLSFDDPIRSYAGVSCDRSPNSVFAKIPDDSQVGDPMLLSMAFDDTIADRNDFQAPEGTSQIGFIAGNDEASAVFGSTLKVSNITNPTRFVTLGDGGPDCKDELLTLVLRPNEGTDLITLEELEVKAAEEEAKRIAASSARPTLLNTEFFAKVGMTSSFLMFVLLA